MQKAIILFLVSFNCLAFTPIKKGSPSPSDGFVITEEQERKLRQRNEDQKLKIKNFEQLGATHKKIISTQNDMIKVQREYNNDLYKELTKKPTGFWEKTAYFMAGALITGLVSYGTIKALK